MLATRGGIFGGTSIVGKCGVESFQELRRTLCFPLPSANSAEDPTFGVDSDADDRGPGVCHPVGVEVSSVHPATRCEAKAAAITRAERGDLSLLMLPRCRLPSQSQSNFPSSIS